MEAWSDGWSIICVCTLPSGNVTASSLDMKERHHQGSKILQTTKDPCFIYEHNLKLHFGKQWDESTHTYNTPSIAPCLHPTAPVILLHPNLPTDNRTIEITKSPMIGSTPSSCHNVFHLLVPPSLHQWSPQWCSPPILQYSSPSIKECPPPSSVLSLQYCLYNTSYPVLTPLFWFSSTGSPVLALQYWFLLLAFYYCLSDTWCSVLVLQYWISITEFFVLDH